MSILKNYQLTLDVIKDNRNPKPEFGQNDHNSAQLTINLRNNGEVIDLTGLLVRVAFWKADGTIVYQNATIKSALTGVAEIILNSQVLAIPKKVKCEVEIQTSTGDIVAVTKGFEITVRDSILDEGTLESTNDFPIIQELEGRLSLVEDVDLERLVDVDNTINDLNSRLSDAMGIQRYQEWNAQPGQTKFIINSTNYNKDKSSIQVYVTGMLQSPEISFTKDVDGFTLILDEPFTEETHVSATWWESTKYRSDQPHAPQHEKGGQDELDVYKLLNGDVVRDDIDNISANLSESGILVSPFKTTSNTWADAINAAINMAANKTIQLPPITMDVVGKPINMVNGLTFKGKKGETFITSSVGMFAAFTSTQSLTDVSFDGVGFIGGVVDDGEIRPKRNRTKNPSFSHAIRLEGSLMPSGSSNPVFKNITVQNCIFKNIASLPVWFGGVGGYVRVFDNTFDNCLDIGFVYDENVFFSNNHVSRSADNGVSISRGNKNIVCNGNIIEHSCYCGIWLSGWEGGVGATGSGPSTFSCVGNVVTDSAWTGIHLEDAPKHGVVLGNVVDGVRKGPIDGPDGGKGVGISIKPFKSSVYPVTSSQELAQNLNISNNIVMNASRGGMLIRGLKVATIAHNTFLNCGSSKMSDGITDLVPVSTENFGLLLDQQAGDTISDILIESNKFIDNRTETMSDGTRIMNVPIVMGTSPRITIKNNYQNGCQQPVTYGLKQANDGSNEIENLAYAKASPNPGGNQISAVLADVEGYYRLGFLKRSGLMPSVATASGVPFEIIRGDKPSILDPDTVFTSIMKVTFDSTSNQPAMYMGGDTTYIRKDINPQNDGKNGFRTNGYFTAEAGLRTGSAWNGGHLTMGGYRIWWDSTGKLRYVSGGAVPASDTDGTVIHAKPAAAVTGTPSFLGQIAIVNGVSYIAVGTTSSADWSPTSFITGTSLPTASSSYRGIKYFIKGATGVADSCYICVKLADDTYDWAQLF